MNICHRQEETEESRKEAAKRPSRFSDLEVEIKKGGKASNASKE